MKTLIAYFSHTGENYFGGTSRAKTVRWTVFSESPSNCVAKASGSGMGRSESDIRKLCPNADVAKGLAINGSSCNSAEASVKKWLSSNGL